MFKWQKKGIVLPSYIGDSQGYQYFTNLNDFGLTWGASPAILNWPVVCDDFGGFLVVNIKWSRYGGEP